MFRTIFALIAFFCTCVCNAATVSAITPDITTLDLAGTSMQYDKEKSVSTFSERFSGQASLTGVMQAYWLPVWNEESQENDKYLRFRFAPDAETLSSLPKLYENGEPVQPAIIDLLPPAIGIDESMKLIAFFTNEETFGRVKKDFESIPENFFRYREGQIQQTGTLLINHYMSDKTCDRRSFLAAMLAFAPQKNTLAPVALAKRFEPEAGCGRIPPHEEGFSIIAPEGTTVALKAAPDGKSETLRMLAADERIVKVETIDERWVKASLYRQRDMQGYLLKSQLRADN